MSNQDPSSSDIFWQTWQRVSEHILKRNYRIGDYYTADFTHLPTKTIIQVDHFAPGSLRTRLIDEGWHVFSIELREIQRDVQACVRKISAQIGYRTIYLQKNEGVSQEKPLEKPTEPLPLAPVIPPPSRCRECGSDVTRGFQLCYQCQAREKVRRKQLPIVRWAKEIMARSDWVVFDTETTDINKWGEVIEIAIVDRVGTPLVNKLIRPRRPIPSKATKINGITNEDVKGLLRFDDVWGEIEIYFQEYTVLAYNVAFDLRILTNTATRFDIPFPQNIRSACIMQKCAAYLRAEDNRQGKCPSLEEACNHFSIQVGNHRALADTLAAWNVLKKISEQG